MNEALQQCPFHIATKYRRYQSPRHETITNLFQYNKSYNLTANIPIYHFLIALAQWLCLLGLAVYPLSDKIP